MGTYYDVFSEIGGDIFGKRRFSPSRAKNVTTGWSITTILFTNFDQFSYFTYLNFFLLDVAR